MLVCTQVRVYFVVGDNGVVERAAAETADAVRTQGGRRGAGDATLGC